MSNLLMVYLALLPAGSPGLQPSASQSMNVIQDNRGVHTGPATWEFVSGWSEPKAILEDWMPNYTEPRPVAMRTNASRKRAGIAFITPSHQQHLENAALVQNSWTKFLSSSDLVLNVVDPDTLVNHSFKSVVKLPAELLKNSDGLRKANIKHIYGVVYMARQLQKRKQNVWPEWWVMKDDDTYVNVHNLKVDLAARDPSKPLMLASTRGIGGIAFYGGGGVALSWQLAEEMATKHGNAWINGMVNRIEAGDIYYDMYMPRDIKHNFVEDAQMILDKAFQHSISGCGAALSRHKQKKKGCHVISRVCACARSSAPATWHIQFHDHFTDRRVKALEKYEEDTWKADKEGVIERPTGMTEQPKA